jgi:hypothetical protein
LEAIMSMIDRLAERHILEAQARGDFENLEGLGAPLELEEENPYVPEELRSAYRLMKNSGFIPPEVTLRSDIAEVEQLLLVAETGDQKAEASARLRVLLERMGQQRSTGLLLEQAYFTTLAERLKAQK